MFIARLRRRLTRSDVNTIRENIFFENCGMCSFRGWLLRESLSSLQVIVMQRSPLLSERNQQITSTVVEYSWASRRTPRPIEQSLSDAIFECLPQGVIVVDKYNRVVMANAAARKLLGSQFNLEVGQKLLLPSAGEIRCAESYLQVSRSYMEYNGAAHTLLVLADITESRRQLDRLKHQSLSDDLTDLYNRRGFLSVSSHHIDSARREGRKLLLIFADLDGLKKINDSLGHSAGDQAIKDAAETLKASLRTSDVTARIGGDEFVVLTTVAQGDEAEGVVARLKANIDSFNENNSRPYKLSVSFGTAELDPESDIDLIELLNRADCRMYEHKRKQRLAS